MFCHDTGDLAPSTELSKTMDPEKQKENIAELKSFGVQEVAIVISHKFVIKLAPLAIITSKNVSISGSVFA